MQTMRRILYTILTVSEICRNRQAFNFIDESYKNVKNYANNIVIHKIFRKVKITHWYLVPMWYM